MRTIQELTRDTQILCDSDEQRTAVFGLCEQAGLEFFRPEFLYPFSESPNVNVSIERSRYFECDKSAYLTDTIPATEFLTDKKAEI